MATAAEMGSKPSPHPCPIHTSLPHSSYEENNPGAQVPEIRAYKLGKKRWSYNQVELVLGEAGGRRAAGVQQAVHASTQFPTEHQDSAVGFLVQLKSGQKLQVHIYLCYDQPLAPPAPDHPDSNTGAAPSSAPAENEANPAAAPPAPALPGASAVPGAVLAGSDANAGISGEHSWRLVARADCHKGCRGPTLRSIQRFGRLGKRSWNDAAAATADDSNPDPPSSSMAGNCSMKDPRYMYLSLDEACTHVDTPAFRLVAGVYNRHATRLLATAVSPPIRVLANNDVPTGAARIPLEARLPADWEGWGAEEAAGAAAAAHRSVSPRHGGRRKLSLRGAGSDPSQSGTPSADLNQGSKPQQHSQPQRLDHLHQSTQEVPPLPVHLQQAGWLGRAAQSQPNITVASAAPLFQLWQQLQQQQQQQQQQQEQQQAAASAWQQPMQAVGVDQLSQATQQLSQMLQLLQAVNGAGRASLGQGVLYPGAPPPQQLPPPAPAFGGLLGSLPSLAGLGGNGHGQLSSSNLISMLLAGASAPSPPPAPTGWGVGQGLPPNLAAIATSLAAAAGRAQPAPAQPASPDGEEAGWKKQALENGTWPASLGMASAGALASEVQHEAATDPQKPVPLAKVHSGAPPTPRDVPVDTMVMLANLAAAAAGT